MLETLFAAREAGPPVPLAAVRPRAYVSIKAERAS
jgi:hypothetical protein